RLAAAGSASASSRRAWAISASLVQPTMSSAPLDVNDRCDHASPNTRPLSKTHWNVRPGTPTNGASVPARSRQRLTVTIGDARIAPADAERSASAGTDAANAGNANQGTDDTT